MSPDEKMVCAITIGYGATQGTAHKSKAMDELNFFNMEENKEWFINDMKAVLYAQIAVNKQKFQSCKGYLG